MLKRITRSVWILSLVSFFTDVSSEMLYPVMPVYLQSIGFSVLYIGILEGFAEAIAGLSKGYFGKLSDEYGRRLPFIQWGYFLSALSKPMMAAFTFPVWIFGARTLDRLGKGLRTGARDALLSQEATPATKGVVFGFHRSMDTMGAVLGPLLALLYLYFYPGSYQMLFLIAFTPALVGVFSTLLLREGKPPAVRQHSDINFLSFVSYWKKGSVAYRRFCTGMLAFALLNSSDLFLLLLMKNRGVSDTKVIGIYIFYNLVYALASFPLGALADKIGLKRMLLFGLLLFSVVYSGMAFFDSMEIYVLIFVVYGFYAAATEGITKALITNMAQERDTATAVGTYSAFSSIAAMFASGLAGYLWYQFGAQFMFVFSAAGCLLVIAYIRLVAWRYI